MFDLDATIKTRRAVRGFLSDKFVPDEILREVLELAQHAPSNCNAQPWRVYVVGGGKCQELKAVLTAEIDGGNFGNPENPIDTFSDEYRVRQIECAVALYSVVGVERDDKPGRLAVLRRNYEFFNAPHALIICMDKSFGIGVVLDVGIYLQTLMLAFEARGISSCAQACLRSHPNLIRETLGIPENLRILCGLSFGYEDAGDPINKCRQGRQPIEENVTFVE